MGLEREWFNEGYEGLYIICTKCGCYGHFYRDCKKDGTLLGQLTEGKSGNCNDASLLEVRSKQDPGVVAHQDKGGNPNPNVPQNQAKDLNHDIGIKDVNKQDTWRMDGGEKRKRIKRQISREIYEIKGKRI